ncbi:MAG: HPP family protein [Planctomycetes bacterium]|nr:HPP family protein [Planctomycetota bacterium]
MDNELNEKIKDRFKTLWKNYLLQSLLAAITLLILALALGEDKMVLISAIGGTAFIVFAMPNTDSAKPKNVITSHLLGLIAGSIFYFTNFPYYIEWPLAVGIAIFLMVALDFIHPPAAGTALASAIYQAPLNTLITILAATLIISQCRHLLRNYLKNLV